MLEVLISNWPYFLLIGIFVGFSIAMMRVMGRGDGGNNYLSLMHDQVKETRAQVAIQVQLLENIKQQTIALDRIATALED